MAYTFHRETSDGVQTLYSLQFAYLEQADVYVYAGDDESWQTQLSYEWADENTIRLTNLSEVPNGTEFTIRRIMTKERLIQIFENRSIRGYAVDDENYHALYLIQELLDGFSTGVVVGGTDGVGGGGDGGGGTNPGGGDHNHDDKYKKLTVQTTDASGILPNWAAWVADTRDAAATRRTPDNPADGEEITACDLHDNAATNNITVTTPTGQTITQAVINSDGGSKKWRYNSTTSNWDLVFKCGGGSGGGGVDPGTTELIDVSAGTNAPTFVHIRDIATDAVGAKLLVVDNPDDGSVHQVWEKDFVSDTWTRLDTIGTVDLHQHTHTVCMSHDGNVRVAMSIDTTPATVYRSILNIFENNAWTAVVVPTDAWCIEVRCDATANTIVAFDSVADIVDIYDRATGTWREFPAPQYAVTFDVTQDGKFAYFANNITYKVARLDLNSGDITDVSYNGDWDYPLRVTCRNSKPYVMKATNTGPDTEDPVSVWELNGSTWSEVVTAAQFGIVYPECISYADNVRDKQYYAAGPKVYTHDADLVVELPSGDKAYSMSGVDDYIHIDVASLDTGDTIELTMRLSPTMSEKYEGVIVGDAGSIYGYEILTAQNNNTFSKVTAVTLLDGVVIGSGAPRPTDELLHTVKHTAQSLVTLPGGLRIGCATAFNAGCTAGIFMDIVLTLGGVVHTFPVDDGSGSVLRSTDNSPLTATIVNHREAGWVARPVQETVTSLTLPADISEEATFWFPSTGSQISTRSTSPSPRVGSAYLFAGSQSVNVSVYNSIDPVPDTGKTWAQLQAEGAKVRLTWAHRSFSGVDKCRMGVRQIDSFSATISDTWGVLVAPPSDAWVDAELTVDLAADVTNIDLLVEFQRISGSNSDGYIDDIRVDIIT